MNRNTLRSTFHLTLFERQLVRSYLLSDNGNLLKEIARHYDINIITSKDLDSLINDKIREFDMESFTTTTVFGKYRENYAIKIISSVFRFSNKSLTTIQVINLQRALGSTRFKTVLRFANYWCMSNSVIIKRFLRYIYYILFKFTNLNNHFQPNLNLNKQDILFITSLCPLRGEDIPIGVFFKKRKVKIIGSVRSWDNLSFNIFPLVPDYFLCHSQYMLNNAIGKQGIKKDRILMSVTPSYQSQFLINKPKEEKVFVNFSYMCQGLIVNPDDANFVKWLVGLWEKMPTNYVLDIIQHPSFIMHNLQTNLPPNINLIVFNYETTTLDDYYGHLLEMDLVFGGGTTGLLDASFLGIPVLAVKFEIVQQNFWRSTLRHFDYFPWTADFFNESKIPVANNTTELENFIRNHKNVPQLEKITVEKYTGNPNYRISDIILSKILS